MIQARELMQNNWIEEQILGRVKVCAINETYVVVTVKHMDLERNITNKEMQIHLSDIDPIPLSPELLINNCSFTKDDDFYFIQPEMENIQYRIKQVGNGWLFSKGFGSNWNDELVTIKYLHELQNIFYCLQKEELIVKL